MALIRQSRFSSGAILGRQEAPTQRHWRASHRGSRRSLVESLSLSDVSVRPALVLARSDAVNDSFDDCGEIARGELRRHTEELANRNTGQKTPSCAFDRCPCRQRLLRFACHGVPVHPKFVDCIQEPLELTRVHVSFRFEEVRELAGVRLEIDLASFPFLDEFEAARVGADADTGARDHGLGPFCGASVISLCSEDGGGGEAPRVLEQFEQGLAFARAGQVLRERLGVLAKATAQMQECVGVPPVLAELGAQGGFDFLLAMPEEIVERFGIPNDSFVQCRETDRHGALPGGGCGPSAISVSSPRADYERISYCTTSGGCVVRDRREKKSPPRTGSERSRPSRRRNESSFSNKATTTHSVAGCWPCASQASRQPGADLIAAECLRRMSTPSASLPSLNRKRENRRNMSGGRRPTPKDLAEASSRALRVDDTEQVALGILEDYEVFSRLPRPVAGRAEAQQPFDLTFLVVRVQVEMQSASLGRHPIDRDVGRVSLRVLQDHERVSGSGRPTWHVAKRRLPERQHSIEVVDVDHDRPDSHRAVLHDSRDPREGR